MSVILDTMIVMAPATTVLGLVHYVRNGYSNSSEVTPSVLVAHASVIVDTMIAMASAAQLLGLVHYVSNSYSNDSNS